MFFNGSLLLMISGVVIVLMSLTVHEVAHGFAAYKLGDPTAKNQGRLSLNPIKHLDPIGALLLFIFGFGWAKPVPVNPYYFNGDRRKGMMVVSFAGPASNLILAFILIAIYAIGHFGTLQYAYSVTGLILYKAFTLNIYLALFNLIPIPPLDGSKILAGVLPQAAAYKFLTTVEQYGFLILMLLVIFNITDSVLVPIANGVVQAMYFVTSLLA